MPEIRVTRSAGQSWTARFNNQTQPCSGPDCLDSDSAAVASVSALNSTLGPMGAQSPPESLRNLLDVRVENLASGDVLRWAGDKWRNYNEINLTDGGNF